MHNQAKILVVETDRNILSVFDEFLKTEKCDLIEASFIEEALEINRRQKINLVIVDLNLRPQILVSLCKLMNGLDGKLPFIIMTSYTDVIKEEDAKSFGAKYFFSKPFDLNDMRIAIRLCLNSQKQF